MEEVLLSETLLLTLATLANFKWSSLDH